MRGTGFLALTLSIVLIGRAAGDNPPAIPAVPAEKAKAEGDELLARKLAELEALEAEIRDLRRATASGPQIVLHVQVVELSKTKMRNELGIDISDCIKTTRAADQKTIAGLVELLKRNKVLKVLAEPTLVVAAGRPAYFLSGGEVPCPIRRPDGTKGVELHRFGTQVDLLVNRTGGQRVYLNIRAKQSEIDPTLSGTFEGEATAGFRSREIETALEMELGQTAIFGGGTQIETAKVVDPASGRESQETFETQTLFLVTPQLAGEEK